MHWLLQASKVEGVALLSSVSVNHPRCYVGLAVRRHSNHPVQGLGDGEGVRDREASDAWDQVQEETHARCEAAWCRIGFDLVGLPVDENGYKGPSSGPTCTYCLNLLVWSEHVSSDASFERARSGAALPVLLVISSI